MRLINRIESLQKILAKEHLDGMLISSPANIFYLSGFLGLSPTEREAYCFITQKNAYFITSSLYSGGIKETSLTLKIVSGSNPITKILEVIVAKEKINNIGFEDSNITVLEHTRFTKISAQWVPFYLHASRKIKNQDEIESITKACDIGDKVFKTILGQLKYGVSEKKIVSLMEICMLELEITPSFPTIVAFGENAAVPHHSAGLDRLTKNQFVLLDFGVTYKGYCSDMTRTVFIGKPNENESKIYDSVKTAQQKAIDYIEGQLQQNKKIYASDVDKIARDYIVSCGFEEFPHSLGHGIGIEVHELPSLSPFSKDVLAEGMVFSIEPGIYLEGKTGVRIEDLFTLKNNQLIQLTKSPKELIAL